MPVSGGGSGGGGEFAYISEESGFGFVPVRFWRVGRGERGARCTLRPGRLRGGGGRSRGRPAGGAARGRLVAAPAQLGISALRLCALSVIPLTGAGEVPRWAGTGSLGRLRDSVTSQQCPLASQRIRGSAGRNPLGRVPI